MKQQNGAKKRITRIAAIALIGVLLVVSGCSKTPPPAVEPVPTANTTPTTPIPTPTPTPVPTPNTTPTPPPTPIPTPTPTPTPTPIPTPNTTPTPTPTPIPVPTPNTTPTSSVSFSNYIQRIFKRDCTLCHDDGSAEGGLSLSPGSSYKNLVNVPSVNSTFGAMNRVTPGNPEQSYLVLTLRGTETMVGHGAYPMSRSMLDQIVQWIADGAPDN